MSDLSRVFALLSDPTVEHRLAAAVVIGALEVKDPKATAALEKLLSESPAEKRAALDAFARIGPKKVLPKIFALLTSTEPVVREAAHRALKAGGEAMVDDIKARRSQATDAEKQQLDRVLADLGGTDAFKALLDGIVAADEKTARNLALAVRERIANADKRTRKSYATSSTKALQKAAGKVHEHQEAVLIKILGWCEDESSVPLLLEALSDPKRGGAVRQEAAIALRFVLQETAADAAVVEGLLDAAGGDDLPLARTAVDTLAGLKLGKNAVAKLRGLALHRDADRAMFAVRKLAADGSAPAVKVLVDAVLGGSRDTAAAAAKALKALPDATAASLTAVLETHLADRALLLMDVLKPRLEKLGKGTAQKLVDATIERLADEGRNYEATLALARVAAPELLADELRALAAKLKKAKKDERAAHVLILLTNTAGATDDDRVRLALLALKKSRLDPRPEARARDEAIKLFDDIAAKVDLLGVLKRDKSITDEQLFYLGFHFAEEGDPIGEQLLGEVVKRSPRSKIGKAAKNKLKLEADT
jgi:hypothetical protein